jgi:hypothetical protein
MTINQFQSQSQAGQDLWVWQMTEHKTDGIYLDVGCHHPVYHSNTYALEQMGWTGLMVDVVGGCESRKGTFINCDAGNPSERLKFHYGLLPEVVDFLSLDAEDNTVPAFLALPWDKVAFRTACIETDVYRKGPEDRDRMRTLLKAMGYKIVCGDVQVGWPHPEDRSAFEDWVVKPELVNPDLVKRYYQEEARYWKDILK